MNKIFNTKIEKLLSEVESFMKNIHSDRFKTYIAVNVKVHNLLPFNKIGSLKLSFTDEQFNFIKEQLTEKQFEKYAEWFLENQCEYIKDFIGGCTINSPKYYNELKEQVVNNINTSYPAINSKRTIKSKLKLIDTWEKNDKFYSNSFDILNTEKNCIFFGRSGGWLSICKLETIETPFENLLNELSLYKENNSTIENVNDLYTELKQIYLAAKWLFNEFTQMHKGLNESFIAELKEYYLPEFLNENFISENQHIETKLLTITD